MHIDICQILVACHRNILLCEYLPLHCQFRIKNQTCSPFCFSVITLLNYTEILTKNRKGQFTYSKHILQAQHREKLVEQLFDLVNQERWKMIFFVTISLNYLYFFTYIKNRTKTQQNKSTFFIRLKFAILHFSVTLTHIFATTCIYILQQYIF